MQQWLRYLIIQTKIVQIIVLFQILFTIRNESLKIIVLNQYKLILAQVAPDTILVLKDLQKR